MTNQIKEFIRSEFVEQSHVVEWLKMKHPEILFTISCAGLNGRMMGRAKKMGYSKGTPDLFLFTKNKKYSCLFIELKTKKGIISKEQKEWIGNLNKIGCYYATVCYGFDEAIKTIEDYINDKELPSMQ